MKTIEVTDARHVGQYKIKVSFADGTCKTVDFEPSLNQIKVPDYQKYREQKHFKKFKIENGNIVWGKDWDLVYPVNQLYKGKISC